MRRLTLPHCPYCNCRMLPQATQDGWINYICSNADCKAVSPRDRSFGRAHDKADALANLALIWHDRNREEPKRQDDFLCEYTFTPTLDSREAPVMTFYGVRRWNVIEHRFDYEETEPNRHSQYLKVLRWLDFKGTATRGAEVEG